MMHVDPHVSWWLFPESGYLDPSPFATMAAAHALLSSRKAVVSGIPPDSLAFPVRFRIDSTEQLCLAF